MHILPRNRRNPCCQIQIHRLLRRLFPCTHASAPHSTRPHALFEEAHTMVWATSLGDGMQLAGSLTVIYHQAEIQHWRDACYDININESKTGKVMGSD